MTVMIVGSLLVLAVLAASVAALHRRGRASGPAHSEGRSASELDAAARSAASRLADRQGTGPF